MAKKLPTIILVHGAWHDPSCWDATRVELTELGYPSIAPWLHVTGSDPPAESHLPDVRIVQNNIQKLANEGKDVVLVGHSYGGLVIGSATEGLEKATRQKAGQNGGVIANVFVTAMLAPKGATQMGLLPKLPTWLQPVQDAPAYVEVVDPHAIFYNDVSESASAPWIAKFRRHPALTGSPPVKYASWDAGVPSAYLVCDRDAGFKKELQEKWIADAETTSGQKFIVEHVDASHSVWLSQPKKVAVFIDKAVKAVQDQK